MVELGDLIHYGDSKNPTYIGGCGIASPAIGFQGGDGNWFPGWIDEVIITAQALTTVDLRILMNDGLESDSVGLLGLAVKPGGKLATTWGSLKRDRETCYPFWEPQTRYKCNAVQNVSQPLAEASPLLPTPARSLASSHRSPK